MNNTVAPNRNLIAVYMYLFAQCVLKIFNRTDYQRRWSIHAVHCMLPKLHYAGHFHRGKK